MRATKVIRDSALVVILLGAGTVWAQSPSIPLGDLVKQAKPTKKAARVITDEDMPQHPPAPEVSEQPAEAGDKEKSAAPARANGLLQQRIADLQTAEAAEEKIISKFEDKLKDEQLGELERGTFTESINRSKAMLESYRQQRTTLEETAAESSAKPGKEEANAAEGSQPDAGATTTNPQPKAEAAKAPEPKAGEEPKTPE